MRIKLEDAQQEGNLQRTISFFYGVIHYTRFPQFFSLSLLQLVWDYQLFFAVKVQRCWNVLSGSEGNHLSTGRTSLKGINVQTVQLRPRPNNAALSASQPPAEIQRNVDFEKEKRNMDIGKNTVIIQVLCDWGPPKNKSMENLWKYVYLDHSRYF